MTAPGAPGEATRGAAAPLAVVLTTDVINMRHYLMAATLAPSFRGCPRWVVALVAQLVAVLRAGA
jgi:predicted branched-subunit amino acid permease